MRSKVQLPSEGVVLVYDAVLNAGRPLTIKDIEDRTRLRAARGHARRLVDEGVFDPPATFPESYRIARSMTARGARYVEVLEEAKDWFGPQLSEQKDRRKQPDRRVAERETESNAASAAQPNAPSDAGSSHPDDAEFVLKNREVNAFGRIEGGSFVVLQSSEARKAAGASLKGSNLRTREQLVAERALVDDESNPDRYRFTRDVVFASSSAAAVAVTGRSASGPLEWKRIGPSHPTQQ